MMKRIKEGFCSNMEIFIIHGKRSLLMERNSNHQYAEDDRIMSDSGIGMEIYGKFIRMKKKMFIFLFLCNDVHGSFF